MNGVTGQQGYQGPLGEVRSTFSDLSKLDYSLEPFYRPVLLGNQGQWASLASAPISATPAANALT